MQFRILLSGALLFAPLACAPSAFAQTTDIPQIQGTNAASPLAGQAVAVEGIVTGSFQGATSYNGFFVQDEKGDGNPATSDGVFVYQSPRSKWADVKVVPGDRVKVSGTVEEFHDQTQISKLSSLEVVGHAEIPAPTAVSLPLAGGATFEQYEGMLVAFSQPLVVTGQYGLKRYGQFMVAPARQFNPTNVETIAQIKARTAPAPLASLLVDDGSNKQNPGPTPYLNAEGTLRAGSTVRNLTGILSYTHDEFCLEPTVAPVFEDTNPRPATPGIVGGDLKVAAANVLNYWTTFQNKTNPDARGAKNAAEFARQSAKIVAELKGLDGDVVGLMEVQNNGDTTLSDLVAKLNTAYGATTYAFVPAPDTGFGTDAIRVALIYKTARIELVGASHSAPNTIFERYPFAQTFRDKKSNGVFTVVVNHFKSKGRGPETGDIDEGQGAWNLKRTAQAKALLAFMDTLKTSSGDPDIVALGDFNAYIEETPVVTLRDAGLKHLNLRLKPEDRYSFTYDNLYGSLDHAFATPSLDAQVTGFTEWHINSDEPSLLAYDQVAAAGFVPSPYRASDHDPLLIGLQLKAEAPAPVKPATPKPITKPTAKPMTKPAPTPKAKAPVKPANTSRPK